jgi:hypothetical protein
VTRPEKPDPAEAPDQSAPPAGAEHPPESATSAGEHAAPDIAQDADGPSDAAPQQPPDTSLSNGSTTVPPWLRAVTSAVDGEGATARLQVASPPPGSGTDGTDGTEVAKHQQVTQAYEFSAADVEAPTGASRYGRPVAQPLSSQPSWGGKRDISPPTVRIGGRVQPEPKPSPPPMSSPRVSPTRIPRRASLQLRYLEPWSVLKVSLVLSIAGFLAWMVAVGLLYSVLAGMGVWDQLNGTYSDLTSVTDARASQELISAGGVFGVAALIGLVNIVLITAMCTVGAFIYNASADLAGGIEITLSERD